MSKAFWQNESMKTPQPTFRVKAGPEGPEAWVEAPLEGRWLAAYRLAADRGVPVVAELRILALPPPKTLKEREALRLKDGSPVFPGAKEFDEVESGLPVVPLGGLSTRVLRRVTLGEHRRFAREFITLREQRRREADEAAQAAGAGWVEGRCPECGATFRAFRDPRAKRHVDREPQCSVHAAALVDLRPSPPSGPTLAQGLRFAPAGELGPRRPGTGRPRGRKSHPTVFYARWAKRYDGLVNGGGGRRPSRRPCAALAERHAVPETRVRDYVRKARYLGLLSGGHDRVAGGTLTDKAREVLAQAS